MWLPKGYGDDQGWYRSVAGYNFALDGTPVTANVTSTHVDLTGFSTINPCVVFFGFIGNGGAPVSVAGGGLTWSQAGTANNGTTQVSLYKAIAASPISGASTFIGTQTNSAYLTGLIFAFSGAAASPYDTGGGALPATGVGQTFTTSNANDILIALGTSNSAIDSPFTRLSPAAEANFLSAGYQLVSSTQSGSPVTWGSGGSAYEVLDAIKKGP